VFQDDEVGRGKGALDKDRSEMCPARTPSLDSSLQVDSPCIVSRSCWVLFYTDGIANNKKKKKKKKADVFGE
jgi:hypothetical protein